MNVPGPNVESYVAILGYSQGSFPQTYLGLPLSNEKLNLAAYAPIIASADKYLSGWWSSLLNHQGRLVLVSAVLDSLPVYTMGTVRLPPRVIDALPVGRRGIHLGRSVLGQLEQSLPPQKGGRPRYSGSPPSKHLLAPETHSPCSRRREFCLVPLAGDGVRRFDQLRPDSTKDGVHLALLRRLLPDYRLLTTVEVGDGRSTSFWHDCWTASGVLSVAFPALYTHARRGESSVCSVLGLPLRHTFVPRLSSVVEEEFVALSTLMADVALVDAVDVRRCPWEDAAGKLSSSALYNVVVSTGAVCEYYKFVWENCAPPKVKFFGWLLLQDRIQTKKYLLKKHCLDNDTCEVCGSGVESTAHLIAGCAFSAGFWRRLNIDISEDEVASLWTIQPPTHLSAAHYNTFLLLCCWRLWKHRHDVVFRSLPLL
jgi:hypothetical protein